MAQQANLFLERTFDAPLTVADVLASARDTAWCFEMYRVEWRGSFLANDGSSMTCWFAAPDAESARLAVRKSGSETRFLWTGTVHEAPAATAPEPLTPNVVVSRAFEKPVAFEEIQALEDAGAWCLATHRVRFSRTFFAADRKRMLCLYEAPDAEAVRAAQHKAGMPVEAVWGVQCIGPERLMRQSG